MSPFVLLLSLAASAPPTSAPATDLAPTASASLDRWIPYAANPEWEILGHEVDGVFRYTNRRRKDPVINFGVNLPKLPSVASPPLILGNDPETAQKLKTWGVPKTKAAAPCGHSDCDNGQCRRLRPKPKPPEKRPVDIDLTPHFEFHPLYAVLALLGICLFLGFWCVVIVLAVIVVRWLVRALSPAPASPPQPPSQ